jgi:heme exporter protein A
LLFEGLDLDVGPGTALVIGGANGVGKSSLLRIAAGLLQPAAGTVERNGRLALSDESTALDPRLPLGRALAFWTRLDGGSTNHGLTAMAIAHLAAVPVRMLSSGQRKRATLARVIASGAALWLLDEPANGLDSDGQRLLAEAVAQHRAQGGALLAATHQPLGVPDATSLFLEGP